MSGRGLIRGVPPVGGISSDSGGNRASGEFSSNSDNNFDTFASDAFTLNVTDTDGTSRVISQGPPPRRQPGALDPMALPPLDEE